MSNLFKEIRINELVLKNRFIMSAAIGLREAEIFATLAKENVGLIISGGFETNEIANFEKIGLSSLIIFYVWPLATFSPMLGKSATRKLSIKPEMNIPNINSKDWMPLL